MYVVHQIQNSPQIFTVYTEKKHCARSFASITVAFSEQICAEYDVQCNFALVWTPLNVQQIINIICLRAIDGKHYVGTLNIFAHIILILKIDNMLSIILMTVVDANFNCNFNNVMVGNRILTYLNNTHLVNVFFHHVFLEDEIFGLHTNFLRPYRRQV